MTGIVDAPARSAAIDPLTSVCVSAPAGSGKTELLIQRYLCLLSRVQRPEQVLAITFTRKAAAEMRERVVQALENARVGTPCSSEHEQVTRTLAERALAADEEGDWLLLKSISRFNIKTIDSFCAGLTRQMPVLSQFGAQANVRDDVTPLYVEAVQELYKLLDLEHPIATDLAALLQHFDNNWEGLQALLVSMLARREQWRDYVGVHHAADESEAYLVATVEALVASELDEALQMIAPYTGPLLDLLQFGANNLRRPELSAFPVGHVNALPAWTQVCNLLLTKKGEWRKTITKKEGFPSGKGELKQRKEQWQSIVVELQSIVGLREKLAAIPTLPTIEAQSESWQLVLHLSRLLPTLAAQLLLVFQRHGVVDHSQVAQSALLALGDDEEPTELALRLDYQIEHILVDEFQDTAVTQYELLHKLTRGWGEYNEANPQAPRTLMIVGDGMQSIYGFRGANVGLFLKARRDGFNGVALRYLKLRCNFRSDAGVVEWINATFAKAFPARDDVYRSQVKYSSATPVRASNRDVAVEMRAFHGDHGRAQEVAFICDEIADCVASGNESIAILGRSRSHLQPVISRLKRLQIPYNAPDLDRLGQAPVVADLMILCRALSSDADRLAWMALLRAPWCALLLDDLLLIAQFGDTEVFTPVWSVIKQAELQRRLSDDGRSRLNAILPALERARQMRDRLNLRVWVEQAWLALNGPECAVDADALLDAEHFFQLLEQAEAEGFGLDLEWLSTQLDKRSMNAGDPDSQVNLLTLHKAKGLEFDRVVIPQLDKLPRSDAREILLWDEHSSTDGTRSFLLAADDHSTSDIPSLYNYLKLQRREKLRLEITRLLYVGATRAIGKLVLTANIKWDAKTQLPHSPSKLSLLNPIWDTFSEQMIVERKVSIAETAAGSAASRTLLRLRRDSAPEPDVMAVAETTSAHPPVPQLAHTLERSIGNVVHQALEELALRPVLPAQATDSDCQRWRVALQREGVAGTALNTACQAVSGAVSMALQKGGIGRWLLASEHRDAHSEWGLTALDEQGRIRDIVIDRSFIDSVTGVRWVIDYKTSTPVAGESLDCFVQRESDTYREQLKTYRDALRHLGDEPLCCALFFPALGLLHTIHELDLAGKR